VAAAAARISVVVVLACKYLHLFVLFTEAVHFGGGSVCCESISALGKGNGALVPVMVVEVVEVLIPMTTEDDFIV
jgi:hypothetical protein